MAIVKRKAMQLMQEWNAPGLRLEAGTIFLWDSVANRYVFGPTQVRKSDVMDSPHWFQELDSCEMCGRPL